MTKLNSLAFSQLIFFTWLLTSCSTIQYASQGDIPVHLSGAQDHQKKFFIPGKAEFYFWGRYPKKSVVMVDQLAKENGLTEISRLQIYEYVTIQDFFAGFLSLGLYVPRSFILSGYGTTKINE
jgi:hypothetical protein